MSSNLGDERLLQLRQFAAGFSGLELERVNWQLLQLALIHPSWADQEGGPDNDRLEFLGDEVLRWFASDFLYRTYPNLAVGELSAVRSVLVSDSELARLAEHYGLGAYLLVGRSADGDERGQTTRLADSFEAVIGALYLSTSDLSLVRPWLLPHLERLSRDVLADPVRGNHKSALQELTQRLANGELPEYRPVGTPPPFRYEVWALGQCWGSGEGASKKLAQQAAARLAYEALSSTFPPALQ
ncbi:ribonuclease III [Gloeobacter kilaueensis]|uniref:Ribonuclease 3 n=1 Tax=Gloeobacter kilaueensis (strain ATCC BAA-2537 / CCAP 1431/1 / ULC 316 / JS1) TaxID=1183438 RepID=U5QQU7_GLOK1|nr:ribonuclease III [Gloeobacter kilaueensis]AGY60080.1 ribonuclease III [Gloeobacter kilaueensis JS1]